MGVVSRKEKVDVYAAYDFQMAYFFRKMSDRHAVLLKDKSLVFPNSSAAMPLISESEAGNAPIPSSSERAAKRRRTQTGAEDSAGLFMGGDGQEGAVDQPISIKPEESEEGAAALLQSSTGSDVDTDQGFYDRMQQHYLRSAEDLDEEEQQLEPHQGRTG
ncbi:hypothetical protein CF326_g9851 [Tilletia indica]|nr:hypothetical protein CF326_g9851 [Tilletia indica]